MRAGWGFDAHPLDGEPPLILGGVVVSNTVGVSATSDGDVLVHAVIDAVLGACALGDLGEHFPSGDDTHKGANSLELLGQAVAMAHDSGWGVAHIDATVVAQDVRISPHRQEMRSRIAEATHTSGGSVSIKATTTDGLGVIGRGEGLAAMAIVTVEALS